MGQFHCGAGQVPQRPRTVGHGWIQWRRTRRASRSGSAREPFLEVPVEEEEKYGKTSNKCSRSWELAGHFLLAGYTFGSRVGAFFVGQDSISLVVFNALRTCCDSTNALGVTSHTKNKTHSNSNWPYIFQLLPTWPASPCQKRRSSSKSACSAPMVRSRRLSVCVHPWRPGPRFVKKSSGQVFGRSCRNFAEKESGHLRSNTRISKMMKKCWRTCMTQAAWGICLSCTARPCSGPV